MGDLKLLEKLYKNEEIDADELFLLLSLRNIINHKKSENPDIDLKEKFKKMEDNYFKKYNCLNDDEKIEYELTYIINKIALEKKQFEKNNKYEFNKKMIYILLQYDFSLFSKEQISRVKKCILIIELEMGIPISFYSEVIDLYNEKMDLINKNEKEKRLK